MSLVNQFEKGFILKCDICTSPMKEIYFSHLCEMSVSRTRNGIPAKMYCFQCLNEKGPCKHCGLSYLSKWSVSL